MSASLLTMQPCSTAMMGNLLSSVDAFNILLIIYDCCLLIRRVIRFRERILRGCCRAANSFISPYSETDADSLSDARHIHDDEHHEYGKQAGSENKQVLCPESLELNFTTHPFIYFKISHKLLSFLCF